MRGLERAVKLQAVWPGQDMQIPFFNWGISNSHRCPDSISYQTDWLETPALTANANYAKGFQNSGLIQAAPVRPGTFR